jgi:nitrate reductase assembly molybdenum cofactor insertion protein NarJ
MEQKGLANITQLENYYFKRLQAIVRELFAQDPGKKAIFWQEVFDNNQPVSLEGIFLLVLDEKQSGMSGTPCFRVIN